MSDDKTLRILNKIEVRLASIEVDLRHHIKRSDTHEELIAKQSKAIQLLLMGACVTIGAGLKAAYPIILKLLA